MDKLPPLDFSNLPKTAELMEKGKKTWSNMLILPAVDLQ